MPRDEKTFKQCQDAIKVVLEEHVKAPLFNMREEDFRSVLLQKLREKLEGKVSVVLKKDKTDDILPINKECREKAFTSRVHAEVRLVTESRKHQATYDIVVLKNKPKPVVFRVRQSGTDVLECLEPNDVAVIIEIKAAPSNRQHRKFEEDIRKLRSRELGDSGKLLVVIDKSMPLGMPTIGCRMPNPSWRESLKEKGKRATDVEVWFLSEHEKPDSMYDVQR
jgi:hypothetical protein